VNFIELYGIPRYIFDMAIRTEIPVTISSRNNRDLPPTAGTITQVEFDKKERTENALKMFGMLIAFTFGAVFIPIAHYILVPSLFIASFVFAMEKLGETRRSEGGSGECPKCHKSIRIVPSKYAERLTDTCAACMEDVEIHLKHPDAIAIDAPVTQSS
jgi:hypothetical protein